MADKESTPKLTQRPGRRQAHPLSVRRRLILGTGLILSLATISVVIGILSLGGQQIISDDKLIMANQISRAATIAMSLSAGLIVILGTLVAVWMRRGMLIPVNHLGRTAQKISQGDLSARANLGGEGELTILAETLNSITGQLLQTRSNLDRYMSERGSDLERRNHQLQVVSEIASAVGFEDRASQPADLLNRIARLIQSQFGYSRVRIFTLDETRQWAVLRAMAGEPSHTDASQNTPSRIEENEAVRLQPGASDPVVQAVETGRLATNAEILRFAQDDGQPGFAQDDGQPGFAQDDGQPATCSELAIPLKTGGEVIGVLAVCSPVDSQKQTGAPQTDEATNLAEDTTVLQILADQIAIALRNAQLFQELQDRLGELETLYAHESQETWQRLAQTGLRGYQYELGEVTPLAQETRQAGAEDHREEAGQPLEAGGARDPGVDTNPSSIAPISIPIAVRGQVIGALDVWPEPQGWTEEKNTMIREIGDRLSQAIDSARLFEEVQLRASRERILSQLTASFTQSLDLDILLKTAVQELCRLPGVDEVSILVGTAALGPAGEEAPGEDEAREVHRDVTAPSGFLVGPFNRQVSQLYRVHRPEASQEAISDPDIENLLRVEHTGTINPEAALSLRENRTIISTTGKTLAKDALAIPIHLHDQVFGVLNLRFRSQPVTQETVFTYEEITNRLSLVLENTRLHYETEQRAERERAITEITSKVRASSNVDVIMQTAIQELAEKLGLSTAAIQIHSRSGNGDQAHG